MKLALILTASIVLAACAPAPIPRGIDAGAGAASCGDACANLASIPCSEGTAPDCVAVCEHSKLLTDIHTTCLASASSKTAARACGSVACK